MEPIDVVANELRVQSGRAALRRPFDERAGAVLAALTDAGYAVVPVRVCGYCGHTTDEHCPHGDSTTTDERRDDGLSEVAGDLRTWRLHPDSPRCGHRQPDGPYTCQRPAGHDGLHYGSRLADSTLTLWDDH